MAQLIARSTCGSVPAIVDVDLVAGDGQRHADGDRRVHQPVGLQFAAIGAVRQGAMALRIAASQRPWISRARS